MFLRCFVLRVALAENLGSYGVRIFCCCVFPHGSHRKTKEKKKSTRQCQTTSSGDVTKKTCVASATKFTQSVVGPFRSGTREIQSTTLFMYTCGVSSVVFRSTRRLGRNMRTSKNSTSKMSWILYRNKVSCSVDVCLMTFDSYDLCNL